MTSPETFESVAARARLVASDPKFNFATRWLGYALIAHWNGRRWLYEMHTEVSDLGDWSQSLRFERMRRFADDLYAIDNPPKPRN